MIKRDPVNLEEMLEARERRVQWQRALTGRWHRPLICLTFNIPGPQKLPPQMEGALRIACARVEKALEELGTPVLLKWSFLAKTGAEAGYVAEGDAKELKAAMERLEEEDAFGRLLDLDVLDAEGKKLSREVPRRCLLCGRPAAVCARSRAHGLPALTREVERILQETVL